jgi:hypothetical protein
MVLKRVESRESRVESPKPGIDEAKDDGKLDEGGKDEGGAKNRRKKGRKS